ncbi:MAG: Crp/Fnr family transcriptional regulator [Anaerolineae bacterium]|nr:Crp/Fnr family transcriptional regulator [Anaerolineae bacterium]
MPANESLNSELRRTALLSEVSSTTLQRLAQVAIQRAYAAGETIFVAGEPSEAAYILLSGHVIVYRFSSEGRRQILAQLHPGQTFNTTPLFLDDARNPSDAAALDETTLYAILKDDFLRLIRECPDLAMAILRDFAGRLQHLSQLVEDLALHSVQERLVRFLLDHAESGEITQHWTYDEIAERLGTVRDMVGRCLRTLEDAKLLRRERGRLVLLDRSRLKELAAGKN